MTTDSKLTTRARGRLALAALLGAGALSLLAPAAHARSSSAKFPVTIEGTQRSTWTNSYPAGPCADGVNGSGSEVIKFRSRKAQTVQLSQAISGYLVEINNNLSGSLITKGSVTRQGTNATVPATDPNCAAGRGDNRTSQTASDCGTHSFASWPLRIASNKRNTVSLAMGSPAPESGFRSCPTGGSSQFPVVLTYRTGGKPLTEKLPASEVFNRSFSKIILLGRGRYTNTTTTSSEKVTLNYTLTLRRVR